MLYGLSAIQLNFHPSVLKFNSFSTHFAQSNFIDGEVSALCCPCVKTFTWSAECFNGLPPTLHNSTKAEGIALSVRVSATAM